MTAAWTPTEGWHDCAAEKKLTVGANGKIKWVVVKSAPSCDC
jgi:hypothetical protein